MATLFQILQFFDGNGDPLSGGKLYWYEAGTSTPKNIFSDQGAGTPLPNPVILDSEGRISDQSPYERGVWLSGSYKLVIKNSTDVTNTTLDDINEFDSLDWTGLTASIADLNSTTTTALLKTTTYTVVLADRNKTILCDAASGPFDINLPTAASVGNTFRVYIKKTDLGTNAVTVDPAGVETIEDRTSFVLPSPFDVIGLQSDGSNWHLIGGEIRGEVSTINSVTTVALADERHTFLADASAGAFNLNLPLLADVGSGFRITIKKTDVSANAITVDASGSETIDGDLTLLVFSQWDSYELVSQVGVGWFIRSGISSELSVALPLDYIAGISIAQDAGDTEHDIEFGIGECRDFADSVNMNLASALVKQFDVNWVAGTNQGGYPSSGPVRAANTWYYLFVIQSAVGVTDAGFDSSFTAANLLSTSGYTKYRRVGSVRTDGSVNITDFFMVNFGGFRDYYWKTPVNNLSTTTPGTGGTITLTVPVGIPVLAKINTTASMLVDNGIFQVRFYESNQDPSLGFNNAFLHLYADDPNGPAWVANAIQIRTDTSSSIKYVSSVVGAGTPHLGVAIEGWIDNVATL